MCLTQAGFFGPKWIQKTEKGLEIFSDNEPLGDLVKEWCDVCQKQCVIQVDKKNKLSVSLKKTSCEQLYDFLTPSLLVEKIEDVWVFKDRKGQWVPYHCQHRSPSELLSLLKTLLSPMAKHEHFLADDVSNLLWIPKPFYDLHVHIIDKMDIPLPQHRLHISYLKLSEKLLESFHLAPDLQAWKWILGKGGLSLEKALNWIEKKQECGELEILSDLDILLSTKPGTFSFKGKYYKGIIKAQVHERGDGNIRLSLGLKSNQESDSVELENTIILQKQESKLLGASRQLARSTQRTCHSPLGFLPLIGQLFCQNRKEKEVFKYVLVVTLV